MLNCHRWLVKFGTVFVWFFIAISCQFARSPDTDIQNLSLEGSLVLLGEKRYEYQKVIDHFAK